ncbi:deoxyribose-phosphate aldolase [Methylobacterium haplocladii]|uniref:Deoxyribose-phosphate aldolase n=1 Tax=Methylobacterium haplocladii TaxID=1176176 RepID=A0A512IMG9_9HYPH|nr:deoxyribose-phosphate aldolase [Methylobacterium haplocladii]GEO98871.1 deoxyribose-phosphate aldolase [Methylobacterium haplocladii]GJD85112.1 Deoxyribose-phosphate aldolase [Methylobacterium haplocladii]GLS61051.1 deoxyribose-phosphate aldolase [Methylobacterium haplocladii]
MTASQTPFADAAAIIARRAIPLLDLTDLADACGASAIDVLCRTAREGGVAAVCVWPQFVGQCLRGLHGDPIAVATVINFPAGGEDVERAVDDTVEAVRDGAQEIDLVLPYRALLRGESELARDMVTAVREVCDGGRLLKVILETGELPSPDRIAEASRIALEAGADFIKTSTGKSAVSATPEAAEVMLRAISTHGGGGLKVSGGLKTVADAAVYLSLADRIMGPDWATAKTMRLGASSLYGALAKARDATS